MQNQKYNLKRNKLAIAVSVALLGGVLSGCNENDPISPDALGEYSILANGGTAGNVTGSTGGEGGQISLRNSGGTGGAAILQRGEANTTFKTPVKPDAANLGDNPLNIAANTTLDLNYANTTPEGNGTVLDVLYVGTDDVLRVGTGLAADYTTDALAEAGTHYVRNSEVYTSDGATPAVAYTGLSVAAQTTLTLKRSNTTGGISIEFSEDIDNSGTITRDTTNTSTYIDLYARNYIASGNIANAGIDSADGDPDGGDVGIYTANSIVNSGGINAGGFNDADSDDAGDGGDVQLDSGGYVLNSGAVDVSGGDAPGAGGNGGEFAMFSAYSENTGDVDASGGNNTSTTTVPGSGGDGGEVGVGGFYIAINDADVNAGAGNGNNGGSGGMVFVSNEPEETVVGEVKNGGNVNLNGGAGSDSNGGRGGMLYMSSFGGDALNSGDVSATGGDGGMFGGGDGGEANFMASWGDGANGEAPGDVEVSGFLDVSGGNGVAADGSGYGGNAGRISLDGGSGGGIIPTAPAPIPSGDNDSRVALLGYVSIDANGGDGANGGGAAMYGNNSLYVATNVSDSADEESEDYEEGDTYGSIVNDVPVNARGGNSIASGDEMGRGGYGGNVRMYASTDIFDPSSLDAEATNKAAIDISGGDAVTDLLTSNPAGPGGYFTLSAAANADNSGAITANGGAGGSDSYMGMGGRVYIEGITGEANNTAALMLDGGDGAQAGGNGGEVDMNGGSGATNNGEITANGGTGSYNGGYGGSADIGGGTSTNKADISVNGGNATVIDADDLFTARGGSGGWIDLWASSGLDAVTNTGTLSYLFGTGEEDGNEGSATVGIVCEGDCSD